MKPVAPRAGFVYVKSPLSQGARIETDGLGGLLQIHTSPLSQGARIETSTSSASAALRMVAPLTGGAD